MNDKLLEQIGNLLTSNTALIRKEIKYSEERITSKLEKKISESQEDTNSALTNLTDNVYDNHEERIQKIEKQLLTS